MTIKRANGIPFSELAAGQGGFSGHVISFDPGETTGWAWFANHTLVEHGQFPSGAVPMAWTNITNLFGRVLAIAKHAGIDVHVVIEDYRVYSWKADDHKFSNVHTVKIVGLCELAAAIHNCPVKLTLAHPAKKFCTDEKLGNWGFWQPGMRHARDAIRHACFYIISTKA